MTKEEIAKQFAAIQKERGYAKTAKPKLEFVDPLYHKARVLEGAGVVSKDKPLPSAPLIEKARLYVKKMTGKMPSKKAVGAVAAGMATGFLGSKLMKKEGKMVAQVIGKKQMEHSSPHVADNLVPVKKIDHKKTKDVVHSKADEDFEKIKSKAKKAGGVSGAILGAAPSALAGIAVGEKAEVVGKGIRDKHLQDKLFQKKNIPASTIQSIKKLTKNPKAMGIGVAAASLAASAGLTSAYVGRKADKKKD